MALQSSGAISINDIVGEFGGTAPHSLSEYYGVAAGIPTSGTISISDFYGASAFTPFSVSSLTYDDYMEPSALGGVGAWAVRVGYDGTYAVNTETTYVETFTGMTSFDITSRTSLQFNTLYVSGSGATDNRSMYFRAPTDVSLFIDDGNTTQINEHTNSGGYLSQYPIQSWSHPMTPSSYGAHFAISHDGTKFIYHDGYLPNQGASGFNTYTMSTPFNLSTATYSSIGYVTNPNSSTYLNRQGGLGGFAFASDGLEMVGTYRQSGTLNIYIAKWDFAVPYDFTTATFNSEINVTSLSGLGTLSWTGPKNSVDVAADRSKIYMTAITTWPYTSNQNRIVQFNI